MHYLQRFNESEFGGGVETGALILLTVTRPQGMSTTLDVYQIDNNDENYNLCSFLLVNSRA
jgi:hypothetical protein